MPLNFASFQQQRGGMAPFTSGDSYLLDTATRVQAEVGPLDKSFAELPSVIPKQMGGRRHRRSARRSTHRKGRKSQKQSRKQSRKQKQSQKQSRKQKQKQSRKQKQKQQRKQKQKQQRGGMSPFDAPGMLLDRTAYSADGTNAQFRTEGTVNSLYGEFKGAQA
jgi:Mg-chelatase subunit ChlI